MIKCGYCHGKHETVDQVKACSTGDDIITVCVPATAKQVAFIKTLLAERPSQQEAIPHPEALSKSAASTIISSLKAMPKETGKGQEQEPAAELKDGVYFKDGSYYKVVHAVHGSGKQYAKKLHDMGEGTFSWEYEGRKPLHSLTADDRLTAEKAKEFGLLYGVCVRCTRTLTKEESIHVGYGSTCAKYEGWWYPTKSELAAISAASAAVA